MNSVENFTINGCPLILQSTQNGLLIEIIDKRTSQKLSKLINDNDVGNLTNGSLKSAKQLRSAIEFALSNQTNTSNVNLRQEGKLTCTVSYAKANQIVNRTFVIDLNEDNDSSTTLENTGISDEQLAQLQDSMGRSRIEDNSRVVANSQKSVDIEPKEFVKPQFEDQKTSNEGKMLERPMNQVPLQYQYQNQGNQGQVQGQGQINYAPHLDHLPNPNTAYGNPYNMQQNTLQPMYIQQTPVIQPNYMPQNFVPQSFVQPGYVQVQQGRTIQPIYQQEWPLLSLTFDISNDFADKFTFTNYGKRVIKNKKGGKYPVFSREILPKNGKYQFSVTIGSSHKPCKPNIFVGIVAQDGKYQSKCHKAFNSYSFKCGKGRVFANRSKGRSDYRIVSGQRIIVKVDMDNLIIRYETQEGGVLGVSNIADRYANYYVFCQLDHRDDQVIFA